MIDQQIHLYSIGVFSLLGWNLCSNRRHHQNNRRAGLVHCSSSSQRCSVLHRSTIRYPDHHTESSWTGKSSLLSLVTYNRRSRDVWSVGIWRTPLATFLWNYTIGMWISLFGVLTSIWMPVLDQLVVSSSIPINSIKNILILMDGGAIVPKHALKWDRVE